MKSLTNLQVKVLLLIAGFAVLSGLYQNFDILKLGLKPVDQKSRQAHARELLGKFYVGSCAQQAENLEDLHVSIYNRLYEGLPQPYRNQTAYLTDVIVEEAEFYDIDPVFVLAIIRTESNFNPLARGLVGEIGLMQVKPDTAEWIAKKEGIYWHGASTLENPVENVRIGIAYLNYLRNSFDGSANKYLSAYNMGARNVRKLYANEKRPKEYSLRVMKHYKEMYTKMTSMQSSILADNQYSSISPNN